MGAWADLLTAWQKAVFAVIYDICLIAAMVGIEVLDHATPFARTRETPEMEPVHATTQAEVQPPRVPERLRPKLASTTRQPVGALLEFLNGGVDIVDRGRTEMTDAYLSYSTWCKSQGLRPMEVEDFFFGMQKLCRKFGIRIQEQGDGHYLLNVQLKNVWVTA
jgi:hypothetical protein